MTARTDPFDGVAAEGAADRPPQTLVLIDDHPVVALGLRLALMEAPRFLLAAVATTPADGVATIERLQPDIVVSDLVYDGSVELGLIRQCRRLLPSSSLVAFSSLPAKIYEREALKAGADRFVPKERPLTELIDTLDELERAPVARPSGAPHANRAPVTDAAHGDAHLTRREVEIGRRLSMGLSVARIGQDLGLSANTVAVHRDNIRRKLNCRDSVELVALLARLYPAELRNG